MNSKSFQIFIALSVPIIVIILVLLLMHFEEGNTTAENIPNTNQGSQDYSGNVYTPKVEIIRQLSTIKKEDETGDLIESGRVILTKNLENGEPLAIFLPDSLSKTVNPTQKYKATLMVMDNGGFKVLELNKL